MARFFVDSQELELENPSLEGENAAHARVLRLREGEEVLLCDGRGQENRCAVVSVFATQVVLKTLERRNATTEPSVKVSIYMAYPKADKLEHVIQKATELGASEIVAFPTARCISRPDEKNLEKKIVRWKKIAASAAEQSGRGMIPEIVTLNSYAEALKRAGTADLPVLFYENEHAVTLRMALESGNFRTISLLTGPEGGLEEREVEQAREAGFRICTLGRRILRCETAPLCGLSAVMYAAGEF